MNESKFFRFGKINQPVNSWLCMLLAASMCFWTVWFFFGHIGAVFGDTYTAAGIESSGSR